MPPAKKQRIEAALESTEQPPKQQPGPGDFDFDPFELTHCLKCGDELVVTKRLFKAAQPARNWANGTCSGTVSVAASFFHVRLRIVPQVAAAACRT